MKFFKSKRKDKAGTRKHEQKQQNTGKLKKPVPQRPEQQASKKAPTKFVEPKGFKEFGLRPEILQAIGEQGYAAPTPIQKQAIGKLMTGRDLLGCAQTGTGKTAAFALPILHRLAEASVNTRGIKALILAPTRELALQIKDSFSDYGAHLPLKTTVVYGGVSIEAQKKALSQRVDILVATPGRLLDLHQQGSINLKNLEILVLDEADRMLDMGFLPDVKRIIQLIPQKRQSLLFSATMPPDIAKLSMSILTNPERVEVAPESTTAATIDQKLYYVNRTNKRGLLLHILEDPATYKVLIFTRTKSIANRIADFLVKNKISAEAIHGNKSQNARQRALTNFRGVKTRVLVASDLASRGIDIDDITHVINFDIPNIPETYVHRIGRTGRAEAEGIAISFCDGEERKYLRDIEKATGKVIDVVEEHPFPFKPGEEVYKHPETRPQRSRPQGAQRPRKPGGGPARGGRPQGKGKSDNKKPFRGKR